MHLHVDADDLWIAEAEYGVSASSAAKSVYDEALPHLLAIFDAADVKATFFVIGRDLDRPAARRFCVEATAGGHEIANHSFSHDASFASLSRAEKEREILAADEAIASATGVKPVGFRAPGYHLDAAVVDTLVAAGYVYDSSILPTFVAPLLGLYLRLRSRGGTEKVIGTPRAALASRTIRRIRATNGFLYELPVSVLPLARLPVHSTFAFRLPAPLRRAAYGAVGRSDEGVYLFHAVDGYDYPDDDELRRLVVPLRQTQARRLALVRETVAALGVPGNATTAEHLRDLDPSRVPISRVLSFR